MKNTEIVKAKDFGLEETKANEITKGLETILSERKILSDAYIDVIDLDITEENLGTFKELRLLIVKNRTQGIEKWKTTNKAYFLAGGNFVQAIYNKEVAENERMENALKDAEKHFENIEKKRIDDLKLKRTELLLPYYEDAAMLELGIMAKDIFESYLSTKKKEFEDNIKAEKEAEEKRVSEEKAEKERQVAIEKENAKLKAEAEAKEKQLEKERLEREKKENQRIAQETKEREARDAEITKQRNIEALKLRKEQEEKSKIEAELQSKKDAEIKAENERLALIEKTRLEDAEKAKAPIKEKIDIWIDSLSLGKPPVMNDTITNIESKFEDFKKWAKKEVKSI